MPTFLVLSPLRCNGQRHAMGERLHLPGETAAAAVARGTLQPLPVRADGSDATPTSPLQAAISRLGPDDPSLWTKNGKPRTRALEPLVGHPVTIQQRDLAWQRFLEEQTP